MIYFSGILPQKYPVDWKNIESTLRNNHIEYSFLKNTKDIWCRDFMPIHRHKELIQFKYEPWYLKEDLGLQTDSQDVTSELGLSTYNSEINLDGGNIELIGEKAILTDRIFDENPEINKKDLIKELERILEAKCYFIKSYSKKEDMTGHVDGYVRWIDESTIMVTDPKNESVGFRKSIEHLINDLSLNVVVMPSCYKYDKKKPLSVKGCYVNYVVYKEVVLFPVFGILEDQNALEVIKNTYSEKTIAPIRIDNIVNEGGLMNCITWDY